MAKAKVKKGRVFIATKEGKLFPYSELQKAEVKPDSSKQIEGEKKWIMQSGLIPPPYSFNSFLTLLESNSVFWACVSQIAQDVAGLGWKLLLKEGKKESSTEQTKIQTLLNHPNPEDSFRSIIKRALIDWGSVGNFAIEVVRNNKKEIAALYYVPSHTIRVYKSKKKYCQLRSNKKVWFTRYGLDKQLSSADGKEGTFKAAKRANELIYYKNFYQKSDFYGVPNIISATGDLVGLIGVRDYNLSFFQNFGIPAGIVILEGEWDPGSEKQISDFLEKEVKGAENAHRTLVVTQPEGCKFEWKPLNVEVKEASFKVYQKDLKENILIAYAMPPERVGVRIVGKLGGNVAEEAIKIYIQGVVEPLQEDVEDIITHKIIEQGLACTNYEFKFNDVDLRNLDMLVERLVKQIKTGMMTPNEARNELGRETYPEGDKFYVEASLVEIGGPEEVEEEE